MKHSLIDWIQASFQGQHGLQNVNSTLISLIPKVSHPETLSQFRPIGLCNVNYKILTKLIIQCIQPLMKDLICEEQSSFIQGRQIVDNIVIIQEAIHLMRSHFGKLGIMAIKVDLEKAYDRFKWSFILKTLQLAGFPPQLVSIIMHCITFVSMQVLWNDKPSSQFYPSRGIRQGDPLSP